MALISDVAVLYVDPRGPYPTLVEHWYGESRDARSYAGPFPVVAHPPCGPWGKLSKFCSTQPAWAGPHAVDIVRRFGGVLEHPADSRLFAHCEMPRPGEGPDVFGGITYRVDQVAWGHPCLKPTWIYAVGVDPSSVFWSIRKGGEPTHVIKRDRTKPRDEQKPHASKEHRRRTPVAFAEWLVSLARQARRDEAGE